MDPTLLPFRFCPSVAAGRILCSAIAAVSLVRPLVADARISDREPQPIPGALVIDATAPVPEPGPGSYVGGTSVAPDGRTIGVNSRYLLLDGHPWLPVMGELHYTRIPEGNWEEEILKMKAGGVQIVATYIFWIHHEEIEGQFDWTGRRDLRRFVSLCGKHGMFVQLRIGPWDHGEVRNGGFPDWLMKLVPESQLRTNTEPYISHVRTFYEQIAAQVKGLLWKDGGPVIGIQLENEYGGRGSHGGEEYILKLKGLAEHSGFDVPLYTVTGWDNAVVPRGAVLPVFGGYMDAPWAGSVAQLPPSEVYAFRYGSRVTGDMGMLGAAPAGSKGATGGDTPFLGAEFGGGMQITYHRRPVIGADDVAAMYPVMIGSGVNLYGLYMFHGGQNPEGKLSTLQESAATNYPNDLPTKSYDFQAPLGEFGQERASFMRTKLFNYFLRDFGGRLAPLVVRPPSIRPSGPADFSVPRLSARTNGRDGFLFVNNYVRYEAMPAWKDAQVTVKLPDETLTIPAKPITIPSGAYFIWPFNLDLEGARLRYATAQLLTRLSDGGASVFVFVATRGVEPEFVFDGGTVETLDAGSARVSREGDAIRVDGLSPALAPALTLKAKGGAQCRVMLLSESQAESCWTVVIGGRERLLLTPDQLYADDSAIHLQSIGEPRFTFTVVPAMAGPVTGDLPIRSLEGPTGASAFEASAEPLSLKVSVSSIRPAGETPPIRMGPYVDWRHGRVVLEPPDAAFEQAAKWSLALQSPLPAGRNECFLIVDYVGDMARLYSGPRLLEDNFFDGEPWTIGLRRFAAAAASGPLELDILPLRTDAPIFLEKGMRPPPSATPVAALRSVTIVPQYEVSIAADTRRP